MNSWQLLGLAPTSDTQAIRRAYALKIRTYRPDTHPKEFSDIRTAYETALREAAWYAEEEEYAEEEQEAAAEIEATNDEGNIEQRTADVAANVQEEARPEEKRPNPEILVFNKTDIVKSSIDQIEKTEVIPIPTLPPPIEELVLPESQHFSTQQEVDTEASFSVEKAMRDLRDRQEYRDLPALLACFAQQQETLKNATIDTRMDYAEELIYFLAYSRELAPELLFQAAGILQWRTEQQTQQAGESGILYGLTDNPVVNERLSQRLHVTDMGIAAAYFSPNALLNAQLRPENPPSRRWAWGVDWQHCRHFLGGLQQECSRRDVAPAQHWRFPEHKNSALHQFGLILSTDVLLGLFVGIFFGLWLDDLLGSPSSFSLLICWGLAWGGASLTPSFGRFVYRQQQQTSQICRFFPRRGIWQYFGGLLGTIFATGAFTAGEHSTTPPFLTVLFYAASIPCALFAAACWGTLAWRILLAGETLVYLVFVHWWRAWSASLAFPLAQKTGSLDHRLKLPPVATWRTSWREHLRIFWLLWRKGWHVYVRNPVDISPNFHHRSTQKTAEKERSNSWWGWFLLLILLTNFFRALTGK